MAFVIEPVGGNKGILVIKHLELAYFGAMKKDLKEELRRHYVVGLYCGFVMSGHINQNDIEFVIAADGVIQTDGLRIPRLPLNGFNFIRDDFGRQYERAGLERIYDFLFIGNYQARKGLIEFLAALQTCATKRRGIKVLCVLVNYDGDRRSRRRRAAQRLVEEIRATRPLELKFVEINKTFGDGLPTEFMEFAMRSSRALVLSSFKEGAARVVAEAEMCGLPVIAREDCAGGSANHLLPEANILFSGQEGLENALLQLLDEWDARFSKKKANPDPYRESLSKEKFATFFAQHFGFDRGTLQDHIRPMKFYNALSSHLNLLPAAISNPATDEIYSTTKFEALAAMLLGKKAAPSIGGRVADLRLGLQRELRKIAGRLIGRR